MNRLSKPPSTRTISTDPGLLSPQELLKSHKDGRRRTLEDIIAKTQTQDFGDYFVRQSCIERCRENIRWFIDNARLKISYDDFMTIATLFVLFGDWIRTLSFPPSTDPVFSFLTNISFFLFAIELILHCWVKSDFSKGIFHIKGYMFNFFFWLDFLCILSMLPDLQWAAGMFGDSGVPGAGVGAKAGKAGKIGAKTGRVVRMARLIRLVKLYKISSQRQREKKMLQDLERLVQLGHINEQDIDAYVEKTRSSQKQSKVGAELSDIITRRVIVAVLLMLLVVPLLSYSSSVADDQEVTSFLHSMNLNVNEGNASNCEIWQNSVNEYIDFMANILDSSNDMHSYLLYLDIEPERCGIDSIVSSVNVQNLDLFRDEEKNEVYFTTTDILSGTEYSVNAIFNIKYLKEKEALAGIYLTLFVVFMLVSLSTQFTGDAQKLVLEPIESMMEMVNMVADDPLEDYDFSMVSRSGDYETKVVQVAIQKITALLRIGFGVAGAEIISKNMAVEGEGSSVLDPMIPGKRVYAIFGFTHIHEFDLCTERLEDEIMTFINSVARIVHDEVTRWGGLCNKNLGNAFLMVWRIGDENILQDATGRKRRKSQRGSLLLTQSPTSNSASLRVSTNVRNLAVDLRRIPGLDMVADKALIGFLKVIVAVNRDKQLLAYRDDKRLTGDKDIFNVRMGFGLHAGWAIEGAVGSLQKVDATYLSPHVNMAARMEAASSQFGVAMLMSERFFELMSSEAQEHCRKLDVVTVKGSSVPMPIYTYDTFQRQVFPQLRTPKISSLNLDQVLDNQADEYDVAVWANDHDLVQLRRLATSIFRKTYRIGLEHYLNGNWDVAKESFAQANNMMSDSDTGGDGPSMELMNYMKEKNWKCPDNWNGYRPLTKK